MLALLLRLRLPLIQSHISHGRHLILTATAIPTAVAKIKHTAMLRRHHWVLRLPTRRLGMLLLLLLLLLRVLVVGLRWCIHFDRCTAACR